MREFAASNTWKDDRKIAIHVENKRRDTDDWRVRRRKGDKNKEQMRSPKVEEWDIRAVETDYILKLFNVVNVLRLIICKMVAIVESRCKTEN